MTKKPISSISFNTEPYLRLVLAGLVEDGKIESWFYIRHYAEEDTKKDHYHLLMIPARPLNPVLLRRAFVEEVPNAEPLGCLPMVGSRVGDWLLYALHDSLYLTKKGLVRVNSYNLKNIVSNEMPEYIDYLYNQAKEEILDSRLSLVLSRIRAGDDLGDILASGAVPPNQIIFYKTLYQNYYHRDKKHDESTQDIPF